MIPLTLGAKIRWRMQFDRNPLHPVLQDKLAVKKFAAARGVRSAEVLFVTDRPETIPFDQLPDKCFIKANHGCNWNILKYGEHYVEFSNGESIITSEGYYNADPGTVKIMKPGEVVALCSQWMNERYRPVEWAYNHIKPMIFAEKIIEPEPGKETQDYRLYSFHGEVRIISIGSASMRRRNENIFFDHSWKKIHLSQNFEKEPAVIPDKPAFLHEMTDAAKRIGKNLDFLRIDFFADGHQSYLSEVTLYPNGGQDNRPTSDHGFNLFLGNHWRMRPWQWWQACRLEISHRKTQRSI